MVISLLFECSVFLIHRWQYWWEKIILWIVSFELHIQFSEFSLVYSFIISCFSIIIWQQLPKTLIFYCFSYIIREVNKKVLKVPGIEQQVKNFPLIFFCLFGFPKLWLIRPCQYLGAMVVRLNNNCPCVVPMFIIERSLSGDYHSSVLGYCSLTTI